jgi:hypothetical protein
MDRLYVGKFVLINKILASVSQIIIMQFHASVRELKNKKSSILLRIKRHRITRKWEKVGPMEASIWLNLSSKPLSPFKAASDDNVIGIVQSANHLGNAHSFRLYKNKHGVQSILSLNVSLEEHLGQHHLNNNAKQK